MSETRKSGLLRRGLVQMAAQCGRASADLLKIRAAKLHLQSVQAARQAVIGLLSLMACLLLFFTGFVLAHLGVILLAGWTLPQAGLFLAICAGAYMILALLLLAYGLSAGKWMRMTQCDRTLSEVAESIQPRGK